MFKWVQKRRDAVQQQEQFDREYLMSLSEKELLVEVAIEMKRVSRKCDEIKRKIRIHSN